MTAGGWIVMLASAAFVWGLCGWCFYRVFTLPPEMPPDEVIPEEAQDFRSA
jgi:hypothetical protein